MSMATSATKWASRQQQQQQQQLDKHEPSNSRKEYDNEKNEDSASPPPSRISINRPEEGMASSLCSWAVDHQLGLSINLLILLTLTHMCFPRARRRTKVFFSLSYHNVASGQYHQGWDDIYFIIFWITVITGLRVAVMEYLLQPIASWGGIRKTKAKMRFTEQAWMLIYFTCSWCFGMYLYYNSSYWMTLEPLMAHFPTRSISGAMKCYYLIQYAYWLQQLVIVNIEERRKDHWQMFSHHVITAALLLGSYSFYLTKAGHVILILMDGVDILLCAAKALKYLEMSTACDIVFGIFILAWFVARHVLYMVHFWSTSRSIGTLKTYGCYSSVTGERLSYDGGSELLSNILQPFYWPDGPVCFNQRVFVTLWGLLLVLQLLMIIWFVMIVRVAYRVLSGQGAEDTRSDDEDEIEESVEKAVPSHTCAEMSPKLQLPLIEQEVGAEAMHKPRKSNSGRNNCRKPNNRSTGLSIPGHSDRKDLLGRIGCDKPT